MSRTRAELETEAYKILSRTYEFPTIVQAIKDSQGDIDNAIELAYKQDISWDIFSGACSRGNYDHEMCLLKSSGYITLWAPENGEIMTRKPDLKLNIKEIFKLIRNGPSTQMEIFQ